MLPLLIISLSTSLEACTLQIAMLLARYCLLEIPILGLLTADPARGQGPAGQGPGQPAAACREPPTHGETASAVLPLATCNGQC